MTAETSAIHDYVFRLIKSEASTVKIARQVAAGFR